MWERAAVVIILDDIDDDTGAAAMTRMSSVSLFSTGGCHERERQPTLASDTTESNSTLHICIFLYTSCHRYNAGARRSWTISLLKRRMVESCGWRAGERESRGHKEVQVPWQPWEAPPSNYSERSESDHLTRGHLNVTSLTIWSVSKLQGQVLERGVRTVPRRLTQLIGRIRRECCKDWLILLVQTVPFSILSGAVST